MSFREYLIEVGRNTIISEAGTTEISESKLHLRKLDRQGLLDRMSSAVTMLDRLNKKLSRTKDTDEKVELLGMQFQEIAKMQMLLMSMSIHK